MKNCQDSSFLRRIWSWDHLTVRVGSRCVTTTSLTNYHLAESCRQLTPEEYQNIIWFTHLNKYESPSVLKDSDDYDDVSHSSVFCLLSDILKHVRWVPVTAAWHILG
jgi:hypothetical protein